MSCGRSWGGDLGHTPTDRRNNAGRIYREEDLAIEIDFVVRRSVELLSLNLSVERDGIVAFVAKAADVMWHGPAAGGLGAFRAVCRIPARLLNLGMYDVSVEFLTGRLTRLRYLNSVVAFRVQDRAHEGSEDERSMARWGQGGAVWPDLAWRVERLTGAQGDTPP